MPNVAAAPAEKDVIEVEMAVMAIPMLAQANPYIIS